MTDEEFWVPVVVISFITVVLLILMAFGGVLYSSFECGRKWESFEYRYKWFAGCQVKDDDKWVPEERFRILEEGNK